MKTLTGAIQSAYKTHLRQLREAEENFQMAVRHTGISSATDRLLEDTLRCARTFHQASFLLSVTHLEAPKEEKGLALTITFGRANTPAAVREATKMHLSRLEQDILQYHSFRPNSTCPVSNLVKGIEAKADCDFIRWMRSLLEECPDAVDTVGERADAIEFDTCKICFEEPCSCV